MIYKDTSLNFLKLLAHNVRWSLVSELAQSDRRVAELVDRVGRPQNLVSYHLAQLRDGGLVDEHRSNADARDIYYRLNLATLGELYRRSGGSLHPALACPPDIILAPQFGRPRRILFLCTHNSARSQMAEALLRGAMGENVEVTSAGSEPAAVHPLAIRVMAERGIDISSQRSKHLGEVVAQPWGWVITVCDRVREVCPTFPQETLTAHWSVRDPAAVTGPERERLVAFRTAAEELEQRIGYLRLALQHEAIQS